MRRPVYHSQIEAETARQLAAQRLAVAARRLGVVRRKLAHRERAVVGERPAV